MDEENWSVQQRNLFDITESETNDRPSDKKRRILGKKQRGYASLIINEDMMGTLNEENGVRETLHNMVKYSSSSNFVFQKEIKSKRSSRQKVIQNSSTR